jgi:hypothetical protein
MAATKLEAFLQSVSFVSCPKALRYEEERMHEFTATYAEQYDSGSEVAPYSHSANRM